MPGRIRTTKELAQRIDRTYFKRLFPIPMWRRILSGIFVGAGIAWLGFFALAHDQTPYSSGPLTQHHALLGRNCTACHTGRVSLRGNVTTQSCLTCHDAPIHSTEQTRTPACAECHVEHRGELRLAGADDGACAGCHSTLKTRSGHATVTAQIQSFGDGHPEFAALRNGALDPGRIRFNHQIHVSGASMPCGACHVPEGLASAPGPSGKRFRPRAYMQAVNYKDHCAGCHPLSFDELITDATAPHDKPEVVHAFVESKLREYIAGHPAELAKAEAPHSAPEWVKAKTSEDEKQLWGTTCARCHNLDLAGSPALPTVPETNVSPKWFTHAQFDHGAHQELQCAACHTGAAASTKTSDLLLPGIAVCRQCHQASGRTASAACTTCHVYHDWEKGKPVDGKFTIQQLTSGLALGAQSRYQ